MAAVFAAALLLICVPAATQALAVSEAENVPTVIDGVDCMVDYHADGTALIWKISDPAAPTELTIPATLSYDGYDYTVTELSWSAFSDKAPNITALTLPDTLTELNSLSFGVFPSLTELVIPGSVKTFTASFQNMKNLERITFSEGVEEIAANSMVNGCSKLKEIVLPESLKKISQPAAFSGASALETINLPEGVEITQGSTFRNCTSLKSVTLPASVTKLTSSMFSGCTALESVTALGAITEVGDSAFDGCTKLKTVAGLESVTKVGSYAFRNCESLGGSPKLSELTEVGSYAFSGCKNFAADLSGAQFAGVGMNAFYDCNNITGSPDFSRLTTIGKNAFYGCYHLGGSLDLSGLTSVPDYAFIYYGFFSSEPVGLSLGSGIESIGAGAFMYMTFDSSDLTIPGSVESIGQWAFDETNLTDVTIDASPDDVVVADGAFPAGVAPVYTLEAVTGDDTFDGSGETIHEAAAKGGAIALTKDVVLSETLVIEKDVTLSGNFTITADKDKGLECLILVEPDAALTLKGVTLNGRYVDVQNGGGVVICKGELNIESGVTISKAIITAANSGTVRVTGELNMTGGGICDNVVSGRAYSCPGVLVAEGGAFNMSGGEISGNSGYRGSAVLVYSSAEDGPASFTMSGGEISGNTSSGGSGDNTRASGAVHVEGYASFTLKEGGVISNNMVSGGVGGGVCVVDPGIQSVSPNACGTAFTMEGGAIRGNSAQTGGGIYSYSNDVSLEAGEISDNTAYVLGGGVYSEGNTSYYSTLHMKNVLITDNSAEQGGGLWFCATGETTVYPAQGAAVFGNSAGDAGDDFAFTRSEGGHSATLAGNVPGGGSVFWYKDGGIYLPSGGGFFYPSVDESVPRFGEEGADKTPVAVTNDAGGLALKAVVSDETKAAAEALPLVIRGNSAQYGGGVGSNGGVVIGVENEETGTLHVEKAWEGDAESFRPGEVEVVLKYDGAVADRVKLTSLGGWEHSFTGLTGDMDKYTVAETAVTNYTSAVSGSAAEGFTITNSFEPGALTITPADITVYMGGSAGYEGVTDDGVR